MEDSASIYTGKTIFYLLQVDQNYFKEYFKFIIIILQFIFYLFHFISSVINVSNLENV
jgi:hypothetical protein